MRRRAGVVLVAISALAMAGCGASGNGRAAGGSSQAQAGGSSSASGATSHGTVRVLYAGSLVNVMEHDLGPAFMKATGERYEGYGAGSSEVANEIKAKTRQGDVFISASPMVTMTLEGSSNGGWVSWYATFAKSPLVLGYNPRSRFAAQLKAKPWYQVVTASGFRLGRTDPTLDPKGKLTAQAVDQVAANQHDSGLAKKILGNAAVFPEQELVGRLQAGQLDAGFFYTSETSQLHIPTVSLKPVDLAAQYTVTVLNRSGDAAGGADFVSFLLGSAGQNILENNGFNLISPPTLSGATSAVPAKLKPLLGG